jgi:hypothetical integral membrane protein (TIGR02206 family)
MRSDLFALDYRGDPFVHFAPAHLAAIGVVLGLCALTIWLFRGGQRPEWHRTARYGLALWLVVNQAGWYGWLVATGIWTVRDSLPLQLCLINAILCVVVLIKPTRPLYDIVYFWGIAGGGFALFSPDLFQYGFPHFRFWMFFTVHGALILTAVLLTVTSAYWPNWRSFVRFVIVTNLTMLVIGAVNWLTGGNYMYLARTPEFPTPIDYMGPWPYYLLGLQALGILSGLVCLAPFMRRRTA